MTLIDEVRMICRRLAAAGWREFLAVHGLDLEADDLRAELSKALPVRRERPEVQDFTLAGVRGIEPGQPAASLLYHLLALPDVHPAQPHLSFPTLQELDTIENYIFASAQRRLADFSNAVVAVFAYQYRAGFRSTHGLHADLSYARTGIGRVGTRPPFYDGARRSFWPIEGDKDEFCVMPARYGAFLAEVSVPSSRDSVLRSDDRDRAQTFVFPRHKLFAGTECLQDTSIALEFREWHGSEKLRRIHTAGGIDSLDGFDIDAAPFVRDSAQLMTLQRVGATVLVVPISAPSLVHIARQLNSVSGRDEIVRFHVPKATRSNRFSSSLQIPATNQGRSAPEYVNIRTRVRDASTIDDLNVLPASQFDTLLASGGYDAAHYLDGTCDGAVTADVRGMAAAIAQYPAYSVISAPDFMPRIDQVDVQRWAESNLRRVGDHFRQGAPAPLSDGRQSGMSVIDGRKRRGRMPNRNVRDPTTPARAAFDSNDATNLTITAVVGGAASDNTETVPPRENRAATYLPDAASDVFAPGWDVSQDGDALGEFYQNYGLGSPFPEDAKLCAALNSFWPAAAPDAGRTFPELGAATAIPLLDEELGFHPEDPRVKTGEVSSHRGWDGEFGPFFRMDGLVNFCTLDRSDYTQNAAKGQIRPLLLADLDTREILRRMDALRFCIQKIPPPTDTVASTNLWLVAARQVLDWTGRDERLSLALAGAGYEFTFAMRVGVPSATKERNRSVWRVRQVTRCQISADLLVWAVDGGKNSEAKRPAFEGVLSGFPSTMAVRHT